MIHLDLPPEVEAQLAAEAQAYGLPLPLYIEKFLIEHLLKTATDKTKEFLRQRLEELVANRYSPEAQVLP